jgi:GNAT superfamily N-acetyltransferase
VHPHLRDVEVERFVNVDGESRVALVAIDDDDIVAVARFDRRAGSADAEVAFVVLDAYQHQGLGTALFEHLTEIARDKGVEQLVANILPENRPMIGLALHDHPGATSAYADGVVVATIPLT